jgi:hypothetical protein
VLLAWFQLVAARGAPAHALREGPSVADTGQVGVVLSWCRHGVGVAADLNALDMR